MIDPVNNAWIATASSEIKVTLKTTVVAFVSLSARIHHVMTRGTLRGSITPTNQSRTKVQWGPFRSFLTLSSTATVSPLGSGNCEAPGLTQKRWLLWQVWDVSTEKLTHRFIGHEGTVSCLAVSSDGQYLASGSGSGDDRYVNLWRLEDSDDTSPQPAYRTFVIDSIPVSLAFNRPAKKSSGLHELVAVAESGVASLWGFKDGKKPSKKASATITLAEASDVSQSAQSLFAASICKEKTLRLACGIPMRPWFETVSLTDPESGEYLSHITVQRRAAQASLAGHSSKPTTRHGSTAGGESGEVAVIGTGELSLPGGRDAQATRRRKKVEISMGERAADASVEMEDAAAAPKADSSAVLLTQALKNEDSALLEDCLSCRDHDLITNTVRRLPITSVLPFLKQVSNRVRSKPGRASTLVFWIRAVLTEHTAYLTSVPAAGGVLAELFQAADARLGNFDRFLKLQGRLDLIMAHISSRRSTGGDQGAMVAGTFVHREAGLEDEDEDDDGDDVEDGMDLDDLDDDDDDEASEDEGGMDDEDMDDFMDEDL